MVIDPLRGTPVAFASTLNISVPEPDPALCPGNVIHVAPLTAVHAHPVPAVTVTDPEPPPTTIGVDAGAIEIVQPVS